MTDSVTIYHNPRCSKSRQTLALLHEHGVEPKVVLYLEQTPSHTALKKLAKQLGVTARQMMRTKEDVYKSLALASSTLTEDQLFQVMADNPKLIERPIVVKGTRAVMGRPPENILSLF